MMLYIAQSSRMRAVAANVVLEAPFVAEAYVK